MTEQTIGQALEDDHHVIDEHLATFARSLDASTNAAGPDVAALEAGVTALRHHIYVEEEFHFPPLRAGGLMGPILVMLREHGELWGLLDRLQAQVADDSSIDAVSQTWLQVAALLEAHNMKEEQIVYPSGDRILDTETAADVHDALTSGETPEGWVCQMADAGADPKAES